MKLRTFCCSAVLFCIAHTLAFAQSITLDSLWGKYVGGMRTMSFSPDSKHLLIADDTGGVKVLNALTGDEVYNFTPLFGCYIMKYSEDGSRLYLGGSGGMDIRNAKTYERIDTMGFKTPRGISAALCDVSPDEKHIVIISGYTTPDAQYTSYLVYTYPERQFVWQKDVVSYSVPLKIRYAEGKVVFTNDGNHILGLNTTSLCKWDWRDSTKPAEVLINNLPNLELISFSPDRNYFVLKSNYIYSIPEKKLLEIVGLKHDTPSTPAIGCTYTQSTSTTVVTYDIYPHFVNLGSKKVFAKADKLKGLSYQILLSKDSSMFATTWGIEGIQMLRTNWLTSDVINNYEYNTEIIITPLPSNIQTIITVKSIDVILDSKLTVTNEQGIELQTLHTGNLQIGDNRFIINNQTLPSGIYFLQLSVGKQLITKQFIITK
ncbi:MAG: T9SS type A sorting domain-containing protein [Candidatus Kapaibacterium sp.]